MRLSTRRAQCVAHQRASRPHRNEPQSRENSLPRRLRLSTKHSDPAILMPRSRTLKIKNKTTAPYQMARPLSPNSISRRRLSLNSRAVVGEYLLNTFRRSSEGGYDPSTAILLFEISLDLREFDSACYRRFASMTSHRSLGFSLNSIAKANR